MEVRLSRICNTTPRRRRDCRRSTSTPFVKGEFLARDSCAIAVAARPPSLYLASLATGRFLSEASVQSVRHRHHLPRDFRVAKRLSNQAPYSPLTKSG